LSILNARIDAKTKDRQGNVKPIHPKVALQNVGPSVQVILVPLEAQLRSIADNGGTPPQPVSGRALIDTGASITCVDAEAARQAGLAMVGTGTMTSATHANEVVPVFAGRLTIEPASITVNSNRAFGPNLKNQGLIALIGRDLLANCVLVYNGPDGSFSLSI
jgi:hypothetical protein